MSINSLKKVPACRIKKLIPAEKGFSLVTEPINGGIIQGRPVIHWPSLKRIRIKSSEKSPSGDDSLKVKGLKQSLVREGDYLLPGDWDIRRGKRAYFYCPTGRDEEKKKERWDFTLISGPLGTMNIRGEGSFKGYLFNARFDGNPILIPGTAYQLKGIESPMVLIGAGDIPRSQSSFVAKALTSWKDRDDLFREYLALELGLNGFALLPPEYSEINLPRCERGESVLIRTSKYKQISQSLKKKASAMGGTAESKLTGALEHQVKELMLTRGELTRTRGWLLPAGGAGRDNLSPMARQQFNVLKEGSGKLSPGSIKVPGALDNFKAMARMGLVKYSEELIMADFIYEKESVIILEGLEKLKQADLAALREISSLSRRELLALLQWMEEDRLVTNQDGVREAVL